VYQGLRRIARGYVRQEGAENSPQATALVHEAYLKLVDARIAQWQDRAHFFAISARLMRRILVDAARTKVAGKRGGAAIRVEINESLYGAPLDSDQMIRLDDAFDALAKFDARKADVVQMRFFAGLGGWRKQLRYSRSPRRVRCATGNWLERGWHGKWTRAGQDDHSLGGL
jgi:RNA polymerase sigma factor (TIGR02999 family)